MKYSTVLFLASAAWASAVRKDCTPRSDAQSGALENGNWFCGAVDNIQYKNLPQSGTYRDVKGMDKNGHIEFDDKKFDKPLGALDGPHALHVRGPVRIRRFAFYNPAPKQKRSITPQHHGHRHLHHRRKVGDLVKVSGLDEWINTYDGKSEKPKPDAGTPSKKPSCDPPVAAAAPRKDPSPPSSGAQHPPVQASHGSPPVVQNAPVEKSSTLKDDSAPKDDSASKDAASSEGDATPKNAPVKAGPSSGDWVRVSSYNAKDQVADNLMFMGNHGPLLRGEDEELKATLAYLNADGNAPSDSPQILKDDTIPSNKEFSIFTAEKCDDSCGYLRNPETAYKGFGGQKRLYLLEFAMPHDAQGGDKSMYSNDDKPAIWLLNARITYVGQYSKYSCWKSGCGELDIFEAVVPGDNKLKSAFHFEAGTTNSGGSSDYFQRPVDQPIKAAVFMDGDEGIVTITMLPDDFDFSENLSDETVDNVKKGWGEGSVFEIVG